MGIGVFFQTNNVFAAAPADKIKAAYIYQLTKFVAWPDAPSATDKAFSICVMGKEPILNELNPLKQRKAEGRPINIVYLKTTRNVVDCKILYITDIKQPQLQDILDSTRNKPVLTVSSIPGFTKIGGIIGFVIINDKVRLEINRAPARHNNIKLSAKLLEVARVIPNGSTGEKQL